MLDPRLSVVLFALVSGVAACSSNSGGSGSTPDGGKDAAASAWGDSACATCVDTSCSQQVQACNEEPSCAAYLTCLRACPVGPGGDVDATCAASCPAASGSTGQAAISALDDCRHTGAGASCAACGMAQAGDAGDAGCVDPLLCQQCGPSQEPDASACVMCEDAHCCNSYAACQADPACVAFKSCMKTDCTAGNFNDCLAFCDTAHPGGIDGFMQLFTCLQVECVQGECAAPDPCLTCISDQCAKDYVACNTNRACYLAFNCVGSCTSQQCIESCKTTYPDAEPALDGYVNCVATACETVCSP